ncbi:hypothetical protein BC830DRAFT_1115425 [Chytriomyces sp. MP71]|nr:hypothetical protein BC830DRAFT_1115425 [Chytriomyces sp. MP71]
MCPTWTTFNETRLAQWTARDESSSCNWNMSQAASWRVGLCLKDRGCGAQGYLLLERVDTYACDASLNKSFTSNTKLDAYYRKMIGPDAFLTTFTGPQKYVPRDTIYRGECGYKIPFQLSNSGAFNVTVIHTHTNFSAVDELHNFYPPVVFDAVANFQLDVCGGCKEVMAAELLNATESLAVCDRGAPTQGGYVRIGSGPDVGNVLEYKRRVLKQKYAWIAFGCRYDQPFELHYNDTCLTHANRTVLMMGDSHIRVTLNHLLNRIEGEQRDLVQSDQPAPEKSVFQGLTLEHGWDPQLKRFADRLEITDHLMRVDDLVLSLNHWPFAGLSNNGHWTMGLYRATVEMLMETLEGVNNVRLEAGLARLNVVWLGVYSSFVWRTGTRVEKKDWRTPLRLKVAHEVALDVVQKRDFVKVVDGWGLTAVWGQDSLDENHFHRLPATEALVDEILHTLNICEN